MMEIEMNKMADAINKPKELKQSKIGFTKNGVMPTFVNVTDVKINVHAKQNGHMVDSNNKDFLNLLKAKPKKVNGTSLQTESLKNKLITKDSIEIDDSDSDEEPLSVIKKKKTNVTVSNTEKKYTEIQGEKIFLNKLITTQTSVSSPLSIGLTDEIPVSTKQRKAFPPKSKYSTPSRSKDSTPSKSKDIIRKDKPEKVSVRQSARLKKQQMQIQFKKMEQKRQEDEISKLLHENEKILKSCEVPKSIASSSHASSVSQNILTTTSSLLTKPNQFSPIKTLVKGKEVIVIRDSSPKKPALLLPKKSMPPSISIANRATVKPKVLAAAPTSSPMKHIVIAIDMEPGKWKSLSREQQQKIIEEKKLQAQKHFQTLSTKGGFFSGNSTISPKKTISSIAPSTLKPTTFLANTPILQNANINKKFVFKSILPSSKIISLQSPSSSTMQNISNAKPVMTTVQTTNHANVLKVSPTQGFNLKNMKFIAPAIQGKINANVLPSVKQNGNQVFMANLQRTSKGILLPQSTPNQTVNSIMKSNIGTPTVNLKIKVEDMTNFGLRQLPKTKRIPIPDGLDSRCFGDIAMIVEFVNAYHRFLMCEKDFIVTSESFMKGLTSRKQGTDIISNILLLFLRVLLGTEDFKIQGLKIELADLPLTEFTVSYLLLQFIKSQLNKKRKHRRALEIQKEYELAIAKAKRKKELCYDEEDDINDSGLVDASLFSDDDDLSPKKKKKKVHVNISLEEIKLQSIGSSLEAKEFYDINPENQLYILKYLLNLILDSEDLLTYYEELGNERQEAYREQDTFRKERAIARKKEEEEILKKLFTAKEKILSETKDNNQDNKDSSENLNDEQESIKDNDSTNRNSENKLQNTKDLPLDSKEGTDQRKKDSMQKEDCTSDQDKQDKVSNLKDNIKEKQITKSLESKDSGVMKSSVDDNESDDKKDNVDKETLNMDIDENSETNENSDTKSLEDPEENMQETDEEDKKLKKLTSKLSDDPFHGMTQRQINAIKAEAEKEASKKQEEERRKIEEAKEKEKATSQRLSKKVYTIATAMQRALRSQPLGYDRHHRLYWLFDSSIPGIYVEESSIKGIESSGYVKNVSSWSYYNSIADIDRLISSLGRNGIRESHLHDVLKRKYSQIVANMQSVKIKSANTKSTNSIEKFLNSNTSEKQNNKILEIKNIEENKIVINTWDPKKTSDIKDETVSIKKDDKDNVISTNEKLDIVMETDNDSNKNNLLKSAESNNSTEEKTGESVELEINLKKSENLTKDISNTDEELKFVREVIPEGKNKLNSEDTTKVNKTQQDSITKDTSKVNTTQQDKPNDVNDNKDQDISNIKNASSNNNEKIIKVRPYDPMKASMDALKTDLIESAEKIAKGSLGEIFNMAEWINEVKNVENIDGIKKFILHIQSCILRKHFVFPLDASNDVTLVEWVKAVERASTLSRLHTLFGILENCVRWEKSVENMRCKVCRRIKGSRDDDRIITCDICLLGYHSYCLRPPLLYLPEGEWKCPKCMTSEEKRAGKRIYKDENVGEDESDHEELCHVCSTDGLMILCDTCPLSYHFDCHNPPLRHAPRGCWSCQECRNNSNKSKRKRYTARKQAKQDHSDSKSSSTEGEANDDDDNDDSDFVAHRTKKNNKNNKKSIRKKTLQNKRTYAFSSDDSDSDNSKSANKKRKTNNNKTDKLKPSDKIPTTLGNRRPRYAKDGVIKSNSTTISQQQLKLEKLALDCDRNTRRSRRGTSDTSVEMKACKEILLSLHKHKDAVVFSKPVSLSEIPDYLDYIKKPVDLSSIMDKLDQLQYDDVWECIEDIKLIFANSKAYNKDDSPVGKAGIRLQKEFQSLVKKHLPGLAS